MNIANQNELDYDAALNAIDKLMGTPPGTPESDELEVHVYPGGGLRSQALDDR